MNGLYLRKIPALHARNAYRVILKEDGDEIELGSIGIVNTLGTNWKWHWGIDTVIPMREIETEGDGLDRADCMKRCKAAWDNFCARPGWRDDFLAAKRRAARPNLP
jgi:hypothetical protein